MADDSPIQIWLKKPIHRRALTLGGLGIGGAIDLGLFNWPTWIGACVVAVCVACVAFGVRGELAHHGSKPATQIVVVALLVVFLGSLSAWGIYRHAESDAKADRMADEVHDMHERYRTLEAKIDAVTEAHKHGAETVATAQGIADAIGAGDCARYFNGGWKLFLIDGNTVIRESPEIISEIAKLDWSAARLYTAARAPGTLMFNVPNMTTSSGGNTIRDIGFTVTSGCPPHGVTPLAVDGIKFAGVKLDAMDHRSLVMIGARKE